MSRNGILSRGLTIAVLKSGGGTGSEAGEVLMMLVIVGRTSRFSYSSFVGMESRSHDLGTVFWGISNANCSVTGVNVCINFLEWTVLSTATVGLIGGRLFLIVVILLVKYSEIVLVKYSEIVLVKFGKIFRDLVGELFKNLVGEVFRDLVGEIFRGLVSEIFR